MVRKAKVATKEIVKKVSPEIKQALEKRAIKAKREAKRATVDDLLSQKHRIATSLPVVQE